MEQEQRVLKELRIEDIDRNPENPRLLFRTGELEDLMASIRVFGVQVPISVYKDGGRYILLDGERRWRCCKKLNLKTIPAIIQKRPSPLQNLLLMFNIHSLREQWDLLTIAMKLPDVIRLLSKELNRKPTERELSERTSLNRSYIRRSKLLLDMPASYRDKILGELHKPKSQQKLTEDFFIEMERSLKTVERAMPDAIYDKDKVRDVLIKKYTHGVITNLVHFRNIAKIARAENVKSDPKNAKRALERLFQDNKYSIVDAFEATVSEAYNERDLLSRIEFILGKLEAFDQEEVDERVMDSLRRLVQRAETVLEQYK